MTIRMIFFDLGGTLVEIKPKLYADSAHKISEASGHNIDAAAFQQAIKDEWTHRNGEDIAWVNTEEQEQHYWQDFYHNVLGRLGVASPPSLLVALLSQRAADPHSFMCFGDVVDVLQRLQHAGIGIGLISNAFPSAKCILDCLRLTHWFDPLVLSYEYPWAKPDRRIYEFALKKARLSTSEHALFIDDRDKFVRGAVEMGMRGLWIDRERGCKNTANKICCLIELLKEIGVKYA